MKNCIFTKLLILFVVLAVSVQCEKDDSKQDQANVYVTGNIFKDGILWKNGVATNLSEETAKSSVGYSVFLSPDQDTPAFLF